MDWKTKVTKARISLITMQPFYGTLAMRLHIQAMPEPMAVQLFDARGFKRTMAVDGRNIWVWPQFILDTPQELVRSAIAHEVGHCAFQHIGRRGHRNPTKWNVAIDFATNLVLKDSGFEIGEGWLLDEQYRDMSADQIYNLLPDGGDGGGGYGDPLCHAFNGPDDEGPSKDPTLEQDWKTAVAQAAFSAKQAGKLPANLERMVDEVLNTKTDWRTQLRRFVTEVSKGDYSWARPNRKMLGALGIYLPSLYSESMGPIGVFIDTSGSITDKMLGIFKAEVQAVCDAVMPERKIIIYCDSHVNHVDTFEREDELEMEMHGGGSTDFRPPFDHIEREDIHLACALYFTDGYGPFPDAPADYPTLWCMTTDVQPPWGEVVEVDMSAELAGA